jgi:hypothetical protein
MSVAAALVAAQADAEDLDRHEHAINAGLRATRILAALITRTATINWQFLFGGGG